jgi:Tfp pilus assembly protein PilE
VSISGILITAQPEIVRDKITTCGVMPRLIYKDVIIPPKTNIHYHENELFTEKAFIRKKPTFSANSAFSEKSFIKNKHYSTFEAYEKVFDEQIVNDAVKMYNVQMDPACPDFPDMTDCISTVLFASGDKIRIH